MSMMNPYWIFGLMMIFSLAMFTVGWMGGYDLGKGERNV